MTKLDEYRLRITLACQTYQRYPVAALRTYILKLEEAIKVLEKR